MVFFCAQCAHLAPRIGPPTVRCCRATKSSSTSFSVAVISRICTCASRIRPSSPINCHQVSSRIRRSWKRRPDQSSARAPRQPAQVCCPSRRPARPCPPRPCRLWPRRWPANNWPRSPPTVSSSVARQPRTPVSRLTRRDTATTTTIVKTTTTTTVINNTTTTTTTKATKTDKTINVNSATTMTISSARTTVQTTTNWTTRKTMATTTTWTTTIVEVTIEEATITTKILIFVEIWCLKSLKFFFFLLWIDNRSTIWSVEKQQQQPEQQQPDAQQQQQQQSK